MIDNVHEKQKILIKTLHENGASLVGFGDVSFLGNEITRKFPVAISLGVKYEEKIVDNLNTVISTRSRNLFTITL